MAAIRRPPRAGPGRQAGLVLLCLLALGCLLLAKWEGTWLPNTGAATRGQAAEQRQATPGDASSTDSAAAAAAAAAQEQQQQQQQHDSESAGPPSPPPPKPKLELTGAIRKRCRGTLGSWCTDYHTQVAVPAVTAPRGNRTCSLDCNKVGTCNALSGICTCPAGWTGFNCLHPMKRHCTHRYRAHGFEVPRVAANLSLGLEWESVFSFPRTHCAGHCDDEIAACFCPSNTTYGRIPAAEDAPLGSPPVRRGRPMGLWCQPSRLPDGRSISWGTVDPDRLWGPDGWCNADQPKQQCECHIDGWGGRNCDEPYEQFCFNQCNGRGECQGGYCKCDPGWHGIDCAHRSSRADEAQPGRTAERPWVAEQVHAPAAQDFSPAATRKRPLIYVYELPTDYSILMLQYRHGGGLGDCVPRRFQPGNASELSDWMYALEPGLLEMVLQSEHRTLDPEEADFFYVPVFPTCFIHPVRDAADSVRDFYYGVGMNRVQGATNLMLEAYHWLQSHHPYWDRRGGRDHIWLVTHDEASCYVPAAIRSSIILSHWGRKDREHTSETGYSADYYSADMQHPQWEPDGWLHKIQGHACYDPAKDLIVPLMKTPNHYHASPLIAGPTRNRTWLAFHRGRVQMDNPRYSRGIRQRLATAAKENKWLEEHQMVVGEYEHIEGDYSELLSSSVFCLVLPGDGWSARMEDATLHGCIPVIIMDNVDVSFESIVDLTAFSLRVPQSDCEQLPEILKSVTQEERERMQGNLARVWQRFTYSSYRPYAKRFRQVQADNVGLLGEGRGAGPGQQLSLPGTVADLDPSTEDDAFGTIMAWLYHRIEATR